MPPRPAAFARTSGGGPCSVGDGQDVDHLAVPAGAELDRAVRRGEQRVVAAPADVEAGVDLRAALADEDRAGGHEVAVVGLDAESLAVGVTAVPGGAAALGLRHGASWLVEGSVCRAPWRVSPSRCR